MISIGYLRAGLACAVAVLTLSGVAARAQDQDPPDVTPKRSEINISYALIGVSGVSFFVPIEKGARQAARDMGVQLNYTITQTADFEEQARLIDAAVAANPDGLVVSAANPDALTDSIKAAIDAGIPTVVITDGQEVAHATGAMMFVGQESVVTGEAAGRFMKENGVTKAACLNQAPGNVSVEARCTGFIEGFGSDVTTIPMDESDVTSMQNAVKAFLQANPDVDGLFALGAPSAEAALEAVEELGLAGKVQIGGFDVSERVLEGIRDGNQLFAADQQQYLQSYLALQALVLYKQYLVKPGADVLTGPFFVTKENAEQIIDLSAKGYR